VPAHSGQIVSLYCAGLDLGHFAVHSDGSINVLFGSDPGGLFTTSYPQNCGGEVTGSGPTMTILTITTDGNLATIYAPCVIGFKYKRHEQLARPHVESDIASPTGSGRDNNLRI
jgi:hypothetical protein